MRRSVDQVLTSLRKACLVAFVIVLFAPMLERLIDFAPDVVLAGVVADAPKPEFSMRQWFTGEYQAAHEAYFNQQIGFRPYFVKTYNQMNFSLFGKIPGRRGTQIVVGKDQWLYELEYIRRYVRPGRATRDDLESKVEWVRRLQDSLERRGIAFVLLISPSKAEIYPEYIPDEHLATLEKGPPRTDYDTLCEVLQGSGVRYVDAHALFTGLKGRVAYPLFAKGGTHWNRYSIFFVLREVLEHVRQVPIRGEAPVVMPRLAGVRLSDPKGADRDLADLLNLWFTAPMEMPTPYAQLDAPFRPYAQRPDVLVVGDSFAFTLIEALRSGRVAGKVDFLYYFKRHFDYAPGDGEVEHSTVPQRPVDPETMEWDQLLLSKAIVILELNEIFARHLGWGFPRAAVEAMANP